MTYEIELTVEHPLDPSIDPDLLIALAEAALRHQHAPAGAVSLVVTDDTIVQDLNRRYRGVDEPTDVLSFGLGGLSRPAADDEPETTFILPAGGPLEIGEIIISQDYASRTAIATGRPLRDELALLTVHGILHLLGHDHYEEGETAEMQQTERAVLAAFGIRRV